MRTSRLALGAVILLAVAQLVPVSRDNPPVETELPAPPEVRAILRRACYDCHSHETTWPWYSRVAPVSWWVLDHVREGREEFNASTWNRLNATRQARLPGRLWREVRGGEMPPWYYTPVHAAARLSAADTAALHAWALAATPSGPAVAPPSDRQGAREP